MRKRSKYRPRPIIPNPMAYLIEGMTPISQHGSYLLTTKIRNHEALANLTQGRATKADMSTLFAMFNMAEALYRMGIGREYGNVLAQAREALIEVASKGIGRERFLLTGPQMTNLNLVMELHDAQLDLCTVQDMERACALVDLEVRRGNMTRIKGRSSANADTTTGDTSTGTQTHHPTAANTDANQERSS